MAGKFIYDKASNTYPLYRFSLLNPDTKEIIILRHEPLEWESGVIEVNRDINIGGVFTEFMVDSLTFIKEGAAFLRSIWNEKELNGQCDLIVEWFKFSTRQYVEMPSRFNLNFATCKPNVKVGNNSIGFNISTSKSSILVKLENRRDKDVDLTKTTTIGGYKIVSYQNLNTYLYFDDFYLSFQATWIADYNNAQINNDEDYEIYTSFQMDFSSNDFLESKEIDYATNYQNVNNIPVFFENSADDKELSFFYAFLIEVTNRKGGLFNPQNVYAVIIDILEGNTVVESDRIADVGKTKGEFRISDTKNISLKAGQSLRIYIKTDATSGVDAYIRRSYFRMINQAIGYTGRDGEGIPIYEAFERNLQHISDVQFPFYSEFFGRTDTQYNLSGDVYISENQLRFANIMSGLNLRGAKLFDPNNPLPVSFDDLFKSANSIWNIGYEQELIDGFQRIRIENYDYFFEDVEILDLSSRISKYDIETEAIPELAYSQIKSGFDDYSYEVLNGRGEYNTESERTTILNTDSVYDNKSPIRGDTMGIVEKLTQELNTEDSEEDNELFIIKTQRTDNGWKTERQENITILENTSLFDNDSFNLYLSPTRMLKRHGNRLKGAMLKFKASYLRFQKSSKLQTLTTSGEGYEITENDDILVDSLDEPIYKPIKHIVTCKFTLSDFETLMTNPKGYITLSSNISGYLLSLKKKNNEDKATIELIEKA